MTVPRDSQRSKVYAWENTQDWMQKDALSAVAYNRKAALYARMGRAAGSTYGINRLRKAMTRKQVETLVARAYKHMNAKSAPPQIVWKGGHGDANGCAHTIKLPMWARTPSVVLHETAHALQPNYTTEWHGAEFMAIFIELIAEFCDQSRTLLLESARAHGLKVGAFLVGKKCCSRCSAEKSTDQFSRDKSSKDGRYSWCRECEADVRKEKLRNRLTFSADRSMLSA